MATPVDDPIGNLLKPLQKTEEVIADLESASDHAMVIGTVLEKELPAEVQVGDVAQAIEQTGDLKQQLAESAETLTEVSAELVEEIVKRRQVSKQLEASRAQVHNLQAEVSEAHKTGE